ncbi:MAG: LytR/AlgR family response regulator transcription factor, partial [Gammaproteobacteria bacterium]
MRVFIADDEPPARARLRRMVEELPDCEVVGEAENGREALQGCSDFAPTVVLLDIRMPDMDGIEAARHIAELEDGPAVIFTTAYDHYAIDAFDA